MNKLLVLLFFMFLAFVSRSQNNPTYDRLQQLEAGIKGYASDIVNAPEMIDRFRADSLFTRGLVQALKTPYSFNFSFDSLVSVRQLVAADSVFKIFSWQLDLGNGKYKQRAAIQMKTENGSLKLLPFFDKSDNFDAPEKYNQYKEAGQ